MFRERKAATTRAMAVSLPAEIFLNYRPVRCSTMQHQGPRGRGNSLHYRTQKLRGHIKIPAKKTPSCHRKTRKDPTKRLKKSMKTNFLWVFSGRKISNKGRMLSANGRRKTVPENGWFQPASGPHS